MYVCSTTVCTVEMAKREAKCGYHARSRTEKKRGKKKLQHRVVKLKTRPSEVDPIEGGRETWRKGEEYIKLQQIHTGTKTQKKQARKKGRLNL